MTTIATHVVLGAGPVARAVTAALVTRGIEPAIVTRSGVALPGAVARRADLTDRAAAVDAVAGAQVVYQCAQPPYHRWPEEFPALQTRALEAAASAGALFVAAENLYGYGPPRGSITEDLPLDATTRKGAVRAAMWRELESAHQEGRVRAVAARASDFFGPGVEGSAVGSRFFRPILAGKPVQIVGDPDRLHTYTYVPDFGEAMVRLSETPAAWGKAWHVPNAPTISTRAFAALIATNAGSNERSAHEQSARIRPVRPWQLRAIGLFVPAIREVRELLYEFDNDWVVDHSRYAALLGDHATSLDDAVRATITSFGARPDAIAGKR